MISTTVLLFALVGGACVAWRFHRRVALGLATAALLPGWALYRLLPWPLLLAVLVVAGLVGWHRWSRTAAAVGRWSSRSRRKAGVASSIDIARRASGRALRQRVGTVRPSLAETPRKELRRLSVAEFGVELCRVGAQRVWASIEHVTLIVGGPRMGKTAWLIGRILSAPGAVVSTSTRTDVLRTCLALRQRSGPVGVFNAAGLGGFTTTAPFDPLSGCADPITAVYRATDLVAGGAAMGTASGDAERWDAQGRRVLAALLHAAALSGRSMPDVLGWVADNDKAQREVPNALLRSSVEAFVSAAEHFVTTNDRTRTSITNSIMPALSWLTNPVAAAAAAPGATFDVAGFLQRRGSLFIVGGEETHAAPLMTALTAHIAREARRLADEHAPGIAMGGRLDPNLTFALDEAALVPLPLDSWTADMGGRGVTILACFQSRAQVLARYGAHKTAAILNNVGAILLFGGTRDRDDLGFWSTLAGERDERVTTTDLHGRVASRTVRKAPVFAPAQIANLRPGQVICYRTGIAPVLGVAEQFWRRRDIRAHQAGYPALAGAPGWTGLRAYAHAHAHTVWAPATTRWAATIVAVRAAHAAVLGGVRVAAARLRFWSRRTVPTAHRQSTGSDAGQDAWRPTDHPTTARATTSSGGGELLRVSAERLDRPAGNGPESAGGAPVDGQGGPR